MFRTLSPCRNPIERPVINVAKKEVTPRLRRLLVALAISVALNGVLAAPSLSIDVQQSPPSRTEKILDVLTGPSTAFAEWLAPPGHGGTHFVVATAVAILCSIVFYAVLTWVVLSLPVWWRNRQ